MSITNQAVLSYEQDLDGLRVWVNQINGHVTVEKLSLVIDAGTVIHPNSAEAQVEGAALWGLSMALHEGSEFVNGQPKDANQDTDPLLRMGDVLDVDVEFLPSTEAPVGLANRRPRQLHLQLEMPSSPLRAHASVICQSDLKPCWKRLRLGLDILIAGSSLGY